MDRRPKTFATALGPLTLERAWYHCAGCGHGFSPYDRELALGDGSLSPAVRRMVGMAAAETSFGRAGALLRELAGVAVGAKQVERHAEALGRDIARDEAAVVESGPPAADTLYAGLDGTGVPVRPSETEGRPGKQADGSAKTREVKLVTVWSAERRDRHGMPRRDVGSVSCNAAIESIAGRDTDRAPAPFAARALRELDRRGFDRAARRVVLGDGAAWIWNFSDEHLPGAIQIVDLFHAKEHVFEAARAIHGDGDLAAQWGKARRDELDRHGAQPVVAALRKHAHRRDEVRRQLEYFTRQSGTDGLSRVPRPGTVRHHRRRRGRLQVRHRRPPQARRHALDRRRRQRHHRPALRHRKQPLRRLPGAPAVESMTLPTNLTCTRRSIAINK